MIQAHLTDQRSVYSHSVDVDPYGPQPAGAIYDALPNAEPGRTRMFVAGQWQQVPDAEVPPLPEPPPPQSCTPAQGLVALYAVKGITDDAVHAAIAQIPDAVERYTAQIGFTRATQWERQSATMRAMAALLSLSEQDLDDLFTFAQGVAV